MRRAWPGPVAAALLLAALIGACGEPDADEVVVAAGETVKVACTDFGFSPARIVAPPA